jgi:hypothetical protein
VSLAEVTVRSFQVFPPISNNQSLLLPCMGHTAMDVSLRRYGHGVAPRTSPPSTAPEVTAEQAHGR